MVNCKNCKADCANKRLDRPRKSCLGYLGGTNADRIRSLSDEELGNIFYGHHVCPSGRCTGDYDCVSFDGCRACWLDWLKSPVEVEE